jgi:hydrogenase expression/formation protein HypC
LTIWYFREGEDGESFMCLGIPMQIAAIDGFVARCHAKGVYRDVNLFMLQHEPLAIGDHVMVHVGYAIQKIAPADARSTWELLDQAFAAAGTPGADA